MRLAYPTSKKRKELAWYQMNGRKWKMLNEIWRGTHTLEIWNLCKCFFLFIVILCDVDGHSSSGGEETETEKHYKYNRHKKE
jgi:hypothetical protein